ncbi:Scr1 family TA system antitoxin-like transcriptional regulator [Streptomyces sp. NPDC046887]|uniref:helix-turn-helix domain-containing protein n=1 Tax=Streptomyces sp. NPDC046887 TaxID=3155472 RepID=UPI0033E4F1F0
MMAENDGEAWRAQGESEPPEALRTFGRVLKALREEAGLTREQFEPRVRYSVSYIAKIEQGRRFPPKDLIPRVRDSLGPGPARVLDAAFGALTRKAGLASRFLAWADIEAEARSLFAYECRAIPGMLQPEPYLRAIFDRQLPPLSGEQVELQVTSRLARQELFSNRPNTDFSFIVEQGLLERMFGGPAVQRALLDHMLEVGRLRNVEIQVMPLRHEDHHGFEGQVYLAETPEHQWLGYIEAHETSLLISDPNTVSAMLMRYGKMRSQALSPQATRSLLEQMRGAL